MIKRMLSILKDILPAFPGKAKPHASFPPFVYLPPEITYEDMRKDFERRTNTKLYEQKLKGRDDRLLNWIGSIDYDGYVREHYLRNLIRCYEPGDENRILLRLADWVPQIRDVAETWVRANFHTIPISDLNGNYRLIAYLNRKERLQNSSIMQFIEGSLKKRLDSGVRREEFFTFSPKFRRYLYCLALPGNHIIRTWLFADADPFNRLLAFMFWKLPEMGQEELMVLKRDKSVLIRKTYLRELIFNSDSFAPEVVRDALFDRSLTIRSMAQYAYRNRFGMDPYEVYKTCEGPARYLLADYHRKEDLPLFLEGLKSPDRRIQYLCMGAVYNIAPELVANLPAGQFLSRNRKIRQLYLKAFSQTKPLDDILALKKDIIGKDRLGTIRYLSMVAGKSFWHFVSESLDMLLEDADQVLRHYVYEKVMKTHWISKEPGDELKMKLEDKLQALSQSTDHLDRILYQRLKFFMKTG